MGLLTATTSSAVAQSAAELSSQRRLFESVDKALSQGKRGPFLSARSQLRSYPLYPYLVFDDLSQRLDQVSASKVDDFLKRYADLPIAAELRHTWLMRLGKTGRWREFLADYKISGDTTLACYYRQALLATGQRKQALTGVAALWLSGYSQPNACDPVFAAWRQQGGLTPALIWQRFQLAMRADQIRLGQYLQGLLSGRHAAVAKIWLAVASDPTRVLDRALIAKAGSEGQAILLDGMKLWSRQNSVAAANAFDTLRTRYQLPRSSSWDALRRRLALFVASRGDPSALHRLNALPQRLVDAAVAAWRVRFELQRQDWPGVLKQLDRMPQSQAEAAEWRYWKARALAATGRRGAAAKLYQKLAGNRGYYGFLAADRLHQRYAMDSRATPREAAKLTALQHKPGIVRARELFLVGRAADARLEWQTVLAGADRTMLLAAAWLAQQWGWHSRTIVALGQAGDFDDLTLRFPLPYREQVVSSARKHDLMPAWVYAVMRQESLFQTDAHSSAGALGLMQLLPGTGARIAHALDQPWSGTQELLDPATNIRYGVWYLGHTMEQLENSPMLATAAYNAGPQRIPNWLPNDGSEPADIWVDTIPYHETRRYVKRVMEYAVVYGWRLGADSDPQLSRLMPPVRAQAGG